MIVLFLLSVLFITIVGIEALFHIVRYHYLQYLTKKLTRSAIASREPIGPGAGKTFFYMGLHEDEVRAEELKNALTQYLAPAPPPPPKPTKVAYNDIVTLVY